MMQKNKDHRKKNQEPFVSVLTPVYNGEEFLRECIESVLKQRYDNWEYVLVNNQSTDGTLPIIKEYAAKEDRIRIHNNDDFLPHMENLNHAFRQISPKSTYCKVVHADDLLFKNCLREMVAVAEANPSVGIVSAYRLVGQSVDLDGLPHGKNFFKGEEIARNYLLNGPSNFGSPTSLLIRSDLIRKRENVYDESYLASDSGSCLELLKESDFGFVHQVLTYTRLHENSVTSTLAEDHYAAVRGLIKLQLEFGPYYLSKQELQTQITRRVNLFYILLARNIFENKSITKFNQQLGMLRHLGLKFETVRFLKKFLRESVLQLFGSVGIDLKRAN